MKKSKNSTKRLNRKSDVAAKVAYKAVLSRNGYERIRITRSPADVTAVYGKSTHYFEIKYTEQTSKYFGAATLTEWEAALRHKGNYWFVVARKKGQKWHFEKYSPKEFMTFSYIPPFKIFFNVAIGQRDRGETKTGRRVQLTEKRIRRLVSFYKKL